MADTSQPEDCVSDGTARPTLTKAREWYGSTWAKIRFTFDVEAPDRLTARRINMKNILHRFIRDCESPYYLYKAYLLLGAVQRSSKLGITSKTYYWTLAENALDDAVNTYVHDEEDVENLELLRRNLSHVFGLYPELFGSWSLGEKVLYAIQNEQKMSSEQLAWYEKYWALVDQGFDPYTRAGRANRILSEEYRLQFKEP